MRVPMLRKQQEYTYRGCTAKEGTEHTVLNCRLAAGRNLCVSGRRCTSFVDGDACSSPPLSTLCQPPIARLLHADNGTTNGINRPNL